MVWTTPLVATLGMSLTIPLAMVADMMIHGRHYSAIYILGSTQVTKQTQILSTPEENEECLAAQEFEQICVCVFLFQVFAGFVIANISDLFSKKLGL